MYTQIYYAHVHTQIYIYYVYAFAHIHMQINFEADAIQTTKKKPEEQSPTCLSTIPEDNSLLPHNA